MEDLGTYGGRRDFTHRMSTMIEGGGLEAAWNEVEAQVARYPALARFLEDTPYVAGWNEVAADCLQADESFAAKGLGEAALLTIELRCEEDSGTIGLHRLFASAPPEPGERSAGEWSPGDWERRVTLGGMSANLPSGEGRAPVSEEESLLLNLITVIQAHGAIDAALAGRGLPHPLTVVVTSEGPVLHQAPTLLTVTRHGAAPANMDPAIAAEAIQRRKAENAARFEDMVGTLLAEYRELYRLVRLFPFYRFSSRRKVCDTLDHLLKTMCDIEDMPTRGVGWRMEPRAFDELLHTYAAKRGVRSVAATLRADRVDALHDTWVSSAQACNFEFPEPPFSLFGINLVWGLKFGGPIVQDRWLRLLPFDPENPVARLRHPAAA